MVRPTGLGTGTRRPFAAKRLHADHGADHVPVDVDIADVGMRSACRYRCRGDTVCRHLVTWGLKKLVY